MIACQEGHLLIAQLLVSRNCSVKIQVKVSKTMKINRKLKNTFSLKKREARQRYTWLVIMVTLLLLNI